MKTTLKTFAFVALFAFAAPAFADTALVCETQDHPVWDIYNTHIVGCIDDEAWQDAMTPTNLGEDGSRAVYPGQVFVDETGIAYECPTFYMMGCVDLTGTEKYHTDMLSLARTLIADGTATAFPRFNGWFNLVR